MKLDFHFISFLPDIAGDDSDGGNENTNERDNETKADGIHSICQCGDGIEVRTILPEILEVHEPPRQTDNPEQNKEENDHEMDIFNREPEKRKMKSEACYFWLL